MLYSMVKQNQNGGASRNRNGGPKNQKVGGRNGMRYPNNGGNGQARVPLLPSGVNNKATMPTEAQQYRPKGEEVVEIINVPPGSVVGDVVFNKLITPTSVARLGVLSKAFQRIDWSSCSLHLVALNGSTIQSGYTMGWIEDPEIQPPTGEKSEVIPFLTSLRSTSVRQNWVEATSGIQVVTPDKPKMYTQLGSDVRRFSPGRLVVAIAGDVGTQATFQLMLKYNVRLYVPMALFNPTPTPGGTVLNGSVTQIDNVVWNLTSKAITYPGVGTAVAPQEIVRTTAPVAVISSTATSSPVGDVTIIPIGSSIQWVADSLGAFASIRYNAKTYKLTVHDTATGQFRAFNQLTNTVASARTYAWSYN